MKKLLMACAVLTVILAVTTTANAAPGDLTLSWTAPGDDGAVGTAATYDIRWSTSPIDSSNWASANQATGEPVPLAAGTTQSYAFIAGSLPTETLLYFRITATDDAFNESGLSNEVNKTVPDGSGPQTIIDLTATIE